MKVLPTKSDLIKFEEEVFARFNNKEIHAPIHLRGHNEQQLIKIFENISEEDWVLCSWASHLEALLKGVPREEVLKSILDGKSIGLCFRQYKFVSSAIVGGTCSIAVGLGLAAKLKKKKEKVWCFIGDMTFFCGVTQESIRYAKNFDLPITFVVADNGLSVCTSTSEVWKENNLEELVKNYTNCIYYKYVSKYKHSGTDKRILF